MDQRYPTNRPGDDLEDMDQDEAIKAWIEFISQRDNLVEDLIESEMDRVINDALPLDKVKTEGELIKAEAKRLAGIGYMPEGY